MLETMTGLDEDVDHMMKFDMSYQLMEIQEDAK
jgi:hypothetical protein